MPAFITAKGRLPDTATPTLNQSVLYWTTAVGMDLHFLVATKAFCAISGLLTAAANISFRFYTLSLHNLSGLLTFYSVSFLIPTFLQFFAVFTTYSVLYYIIFPFALQASMNISGIELL